MPRNVRQKKRAERRVQAAAATAAAAADEAANENSSKLVSELDEHAMGDGHGGDINNNNNNNNSSSNNSNSNNSLSCSNNSHNSHSNNNSNSCSNNNCNSSSNNNCNSSSNNNNSCSNNNNNSNINITNSLNTSNLNNNISNNNNTASSSNSSSSTNVVHNKKPKASRADPILASLSKNALRMSDVQLLHGPHWLNDAILNFYFAYLEEVKYKSNVDFLFVTPEMSQCMLYMDDKELHGLLVAQNQALRKPFIFMALNDSHSRDRGGAHWSLVVASRPDKSFFHFDSYGGGNTNCSLELINNIKDVLDMQHARFRGMRCLQQSNDYDCGIHVICMADQLTDYVNRYDSVDGVQPLHQDVIKAKRNQLIKLVASLGQHI